MMPRLTALLRDPIWQAISVAVAIIAIFITSATGAKQTDELSIYHSQKIKFEEFRLPTNRIRLILLGTNQEIDHAVVDYYTITNKSTRPILAADFTTPITVEKGPRTKKIFVTSSCGTLAEDSISVPRSATFVALNWIETGDKWAAQPALLNPGDYSCLAVISEEANLETQTTRPSERLQWSGRIVNVQLKAYNSVDEYAEHLERPWAGFLETEVTMKGFTAYWFAVLQLVLFFSTVTLSRQAGWISTYSMTNVLRLTIIVLLATGSAEALTDIFVNLNFFHLHSAVLIFLLIHLAFIVIMTHKAKRRRAQIIDE